MPKARIDIQVEVESKRLRAALDAVGQGLQETSALLDAGSLADAGPLVQALIASHHAVLADPLFVDAAMQRIRVDTMTAEAAIDHTLAELRARFDTLQRAEFRSWFRDVEGLAGEVLGQLAEDTDQAPFRCEPGQIVIAQDLTISDVISLLQCGVAGIALLGSSLTSHVAVLCRSTGLPAVTGLDAELLRSREIDDERLEINGDTGLVRWYRSGQEDTTGATIAPALLTPDRSAASLTPADQTAPAVCLRANLDVRLDASWAQSQGTTGVGLWRTIYSYLGRRELPTEDELTAQFSRVLRDFAPEIVTVRLLDLSSPTAQRELPPELRNLGGCRGIRLRHIRPEVLRTQLRALVRAAPHGRLRILVPFVTSPVELRWVRAVIAAAQSQLADQRSSGAPTIPVGAMIEVPAALFNLEELAPCADFFAIGSNDLAALLLARPREGTWRCDGGDPALERRVLLRAIRTVVAAAERAKITVSLCGELAADPTATASLVAAGLRELSLSPRLAPPVRRALTACAP